MLILVSLFVVAMLLSSLLTGWLRRYALAASLIDIPNARSSHKLPTPRGGGLSIVIVFLLGLLALFAFDLVETSVLWALLGAGALVALTGFLDDHGHIAAGWRLLVHFSAAAWGLYCLGGLPPLILPVPGLSMMALDLGWIGQILAALYLVWLLNLYNFMDGIDGIASIEAITVSLGAALLYAMQTGANTLWVTPVLLAMTVVGFLVWNFPPAKIFMGDAGSGFLGIVLGLLSIQAAWVNPLFLWSWLILLAVFITDATWTLFRRLLRGDKVYQAHCSHAYQYAARFYGSHKKVSLAVAIINFVWLLPLALGVALNQLNAGFALILAYLPLVVLVIIFRAGQRESV
ncbi:MAG: glycosyltransferase family 4 protein [Methylococcales bacterium]|nr:MAG: glycosyltransferase family 4 protein [Methylococcales bacterium]